MASLPKALRETVKEFLEDVSQHLSNNGCNDWQFSKSEKAAAKKFLGTKYVNEAGDINSDYDVLAIIEKSLGFEPTRDRDDEGDEPYPDADDSR